MPTLATIALHNARTRRSELAYQFTPKHHGGDRNATQWLPELTLGEEFAIFDMADEHELADAGGTLFGLQREGQDSLRSLGTQREQIAKFPYARPGEAWHGYPVYPIEGLGQKDRPAKEVFVRMVERGMISGEMKRRLMGGKHV